jgi:hypothetical protein
MKLKILFIFMFLFSAGTSAASNKLSISLQKLVSIESKILKKGKLDYWVEAYKASLYTIRNNVREIYHNEELNFNNIIETNLADFYVSDAGKEFANDHRIQIKIIPDIERTFLRATHYNVKFFGFNETKLAEIRNNSKPLVLDLNIQYELSSKFINKVSELEREKLVQIQSLLVNRIEFLNNYDEVRDYFVKGDVSTAGASTIKNTLNDLIDVTQSIDNKIAKYSNSFSAKCEDHFELGKKSYKKIIDSAQKILSIDGLARSARFGMMWNKNSVEVKKPSTIQAKSILEFELLFRLLNSYDTLFLENNEVSRGLLGTSSSTCIEEGRDSLHTLIMLRKEILYTLKQQVLGRRGVWDVMNISNLFVTEARLEQKRKIKNIIIWTSVGTAASIAFPFVAPLALSYIPNAVNIGKSMKFAYIGYGLYAGSKVGYQVYDSLNNMENNPFLDGNPHRIIKMQYDSINALSDNALDLYKFSKEYEKSLHLEFLKLTPGTTSQKWTKEAIKRFGTLQKTKEAYSMQVEYVESLL